MNKFNKSQYVAMFQSDITGKNPYLVFAYLEYVKGAIPPPFVDIHGIKYVLAENQQEVARAFDTSQQNISRWIKNEKTVKHEKEL